MSGNPKLGKVVKYMAFGTTIASALAGMVAGGYFVGHYLDLLFETNYIFTLALMLLGVGLGLGYMIITINKLGKSKDES